MTFDPLRPALIGSLILTMAILTGCREEEQDRVLLYKKGTYLGQADSGLSEEQLQQLRSRASTQGHKL